MTDLHHAQPFAMAFRLSNADIDTLKKKLAHVTTSVDTELDSITQRALEDYGHEGLQVVRSHVVAKVDQMLANALLPTMVAQYGRFRLSDPSCNPIRKLLCNAGITTRIQWDGIRLGRTTRNPPRAAQANPAAASSADPVAPQRTRRRGGKPQRWVPPEGPAGKWSSVSPVIAKQKRAEKTQRRARARDRSANRTKVPVTPASGDTAVVEWLIDGQERVFSATVEDGGVCRFEDGTVEPWSSCTNARHRLFHPGEAVSVCYHSRSRLKRGLFSGLFADGVAYMMNGESVQLDRVEWFSN